MLSDLENILHLRNVKDEKFSFACSHAIIFYKKQMAQSPIPVQTVVAHRALCTQQLNRSALHALWQCGRGQCGRGLLPESSWFLKVTCNNEGDTCYTLPLPDSCPTTLAASVAWFQSSFQQVICSMKKGEVISFLHLARHLEQYGRAVPGRRNNQPSCRKYWYLVMLPCTHQLLRGGICLKTGGERSSRFPQAKTHRNGALLFFTCDQKWVIFCSSEEGRNGVAAAPVNQ